MPWWVLGWDVVCWLGHRRFARHWAVGQIRTELADTYQIRLSDDAIERYIHRYQQMLAARQHDPSQLAAAYADVDAVILSIDGLQPEKGHETLYVVRELERKRVWFAEALLSSATAEVQQLLAQARSWAAELGKPVRLWISDKQGAFVRGSQRSSRGATPLLRQSLSTGCSQAGLGSRQPRQGAHAANVRGLRAIEREVLTEQRTPALPRRSRLHARPPRPTQSRRMRRLRKWCSIIARRYAASSTTIKGGPCIHRDTDGRGLGGRARSLQRNLEAKKGGLLTPVWDV